jgi:hypothetical protein
VKDINNIYVEPQLDEFMDKLNDVARYYKFNIDGSFKCTAEDTKGIPSSDIPDNNVPDLTKDRKIEILTTLTQALVIFDAIIYKYMQQKDANLQEIKKNIIDTINNYDYKKIKCDGHKKSKFAGLFENIMGRKDKKADEYSQISLLPIDISLYDYSFQGGNFKKGMVYLSKTTGTTITIKSKISGKEYDETYGSGKPGSYTVKHIAKVTVTDSKKNNSIYRIIYKRDHYNIEFIEPSKKSKCTIF